MSGARKGKAISMRVANVFKRLMGWLLVVVGVGLGVLVLVGAKKHYTDASVVPVIISECIALLLLILGLNLARQGRWGR